MAIQQDLVLVLPNRMHVKVRLPMGEQVMTVSEGRGFQSMGAQGRELSAEQVEQQLADLGRDLLFLARYSDSPEVEAVAAGAGEVDGTVCGWVEVTLGEASSRLCVDVEGRVLKQTYRGTHPFTGAPGSFEVVFSDYRDTGGFLVPYREVTRIDGVDFSITTRQHAEINPEIDPALFERPAA